MEVDILVFAAHPDDAELSCSGTIAAHVAAGYSCGIIDLTRGEMGTRGTPELRMIEAGKSAKILGLTIRENLGFEDVKFLNNWDHQIEVIRMIRKYKPKVVLANAVSDRHPDHERAAALLKEAYFKTGLTKLKTFDQGKEQTAFRPDRLYHYIQSNYIEPDFVVDISDYWDIKKSSIEAFNSQFFNPQSKEPETFISSAGFMDLIKSRAVEYGQRIGVAYGEGFISSTTPAVKDIFSMI